MGYLILIVIFLIIINLVFKAMNKKTFYWETIVKYLWEIIYRKSEKMADWIKYSDAKKESEEDQNKLIETFKKDMIVPGNLINAILDWVNKLKKEEEGYDDESEEDDFEEETFGYGRFDFDQILNLAKTNPDVFKEVKK